MRIRNEITQLRWVVRGELDRELRRQRREVRRHLSLPQLPKRRRRVGEVWGISMVRNEADIVRTTLEHLLDQGLDRLLVSDNLSTDGTRQILQSLARNDPRILVATDDLDAFHQDHKITLLARHASLAGADWLVPFDGDEMWFAESRSVAEHLRQLGLEQDVVGTVTASSHDCIPLSPVVDDRRSSSFLLNATPAELKKVAVRAHPTVRISAGNHRAARAGAVRAGLRIAHAAYRGPDQLARKVRDGVEALTLANQASGIGWHWRHLAKLSDDEVAQLWAQAQSGESLPEVPLNVGGPMVPCRPLAWQTWDPNRCLTPRQGEVSS